ncbi:MAG: hypothetical protein AAF547_11275 [Actinomycetota bacterium]
MADREIDHTVEVDPATMARIRAALQQSGRLTEDGPPTADEVPEDHVEPSPFDRTGEVGETEQRDAAPAPTRANPAPGPVVQRIAPSPGRQHRTELRPTPRVAVEATGSPSARPTPVERATPVATVRPASLERGARWELPTAALDPVPRAERGGNRVWPWMLATFVLFNAAIILAGVVALGWGQTSGADQDPDPASVQIDGTVDGPEGEPQRGGSDE